MLLEFWMNNTYGQAWLPVSVAKVGYLVWYCLMFLDDAAH